MDMTWEYIAGFFDGEGCIQGYLSTPRVSIAQKRPLVLQEIQKFLWEQDIRSQIFRYSSEKKDLSQLRINAGEEVASFVENVLPFLIVKKEECIVALNKIRLGSRKRRKWRVSELMQLKRLREGGKTAPEISKIMQRPLRTVEAYCYRDGNFAQRYDLIGFTNKL